MKKLFLILSGILLKTYSLNAQSLSPASITSCGGLLDVGNSELTMSVGQVAVSSIENSNYLFTQGFQQAEPCLLTNMQVAGDLEFCDESTATVSITANNINNYSEYLWYNNNFGADNNDTIVTGVGGTYNVTITNFRGCFLDTNIVLVKHPKPSMPFSTPLFANLCGNNTSQLFTIPFSANHTVTWSSNAGLYTNSLLNSAYISGTNGTSIYAAPLASTTYSVVRTHNTTGCQSDTVLIPVTVCLNSNDDICGAINVSVTNTPTFVNCSTLGATTGAQISACEPFQKDVWYKCIVPSNGEVHVTTKLTGNSGSDIQASVVTLFSSSDNTCLGVLTPLSCNYNGAAGNMSYTYASNLTSGNTIFIRLASPLTVSPVSSKIQMAVTSGLIWTGSANASFNNPANWMGGDATAITVPSATKSVIIRPVTSPALAPAIVGAQDAKNLTMQTNALMSIGAGATLSIKGDVNLSGNSITGTGFLEMNGTSAQVIGTTGRVNYLKINNATEVSFGGAFRVGGLDLQQGVVTTNNNLTLLSDGGLTGYLNNFTGGYTGSLSGNLNVERRVLAGDHYLASPVVMSGTVSSNYNDDFSVVGSPAGYVFNSSPAVPQPSVFPTTWTWDETQTIATIPGWTGAGATTLAPGQGFSARLTGTRIVDIRGIANNAGVNRAVTFTDDGLNLIGNPYPSSINFSTFASANASTILPVLYIWNPANSSYASYAAGIWSNNPAGSGASDVIGHSQSFFVFATQSGNVSFSNSMRTVNQAANFFADPEGLIRLEVSSNGQTDEAVVATNTEATENYDSQVDAKKLLNALTPSILAFTLSADNTPLAINAMDKFSTEQVIPVQIIATTAGEVSIKLNMADLKGRFDHIYLEDATLKTYTDLKATESYTATVSQGNSGSRFFLHFEKPSVAKAANELGVYAANTTVFANLPSESNGTIEVVDLVGKTIYTANFAGKSGRVAFEIPNAVYGAYIVKLSSNGKVINQKVIFTE